jgi:hypothetical protein
VVESDILRKTFKTRGGGRDMCKRQRDVLSLNGPAHLCYIALDDGEDNHAIQGHVVDSTTRMCYGFMATRM